MITLLLSLVTLLCSIPAMNVIIEWNQAITFPESMSGFGLATVTARGLLNVFLSIMRWLLIALYKMVILIFGIHRKHPRLSLFDGSCIGVVEARWQVGYGSPC